MNNFIFKEINKDEYKKFCEGRDIPLTQYWFYGEWQRALGKKVWRYSINNDREQIGFFQVIKYAMPFGKSYLYIPHGPVIFGAFSEDFFYEFKKFCRELLKKERCIFLRFDPTWKLSFQVKYQTLGSLASKLPRFMYDGNFQPKFEWILDLTQTEDEILAGMKKVNRYTVRQAEKLGVEVEIIDQNFSQHLDKFYELIDSTAERDRFSHNSKDYYAKIFEACERDGNGFMEIARYDGNIMLVNFFVIYGDLVFFLFSGSENENRKVGYTYLAQWEAIKHAKKLGLKHYNFGAVITEDNKYPFYSGWRGFSDFKQRFGGTLVEYSDLYDIVLNKFWYTLYALRKLITLLLRKL